MDLKNIQRGLSRVTWVVAGLIALLGILLIVIRVDLLSKLLFGVMGIVTIIVSIATLISVFSMRKTKVGKISIISTVLLALAGLFMFFFPQNFLLILVGLLMVAQPILVIMNAPNRRTRLKKEAPKLIIGAVLILLGPTNVFGYFFDIVGVGLIVLSIVYIFWTKTLIQKVQDAVEIGSQVLIAADSKGKPGTIYVDAEESSEVDKETNYQETK